MMLPEMYRVLGVTVRMRRKAAHITQKQLADSIGKSASFLGHVERGTRKMSLETMLDIIIALSMEPNVLLADIVPSELSDGWKKSKLDNLVAILAGGEGDAKILDQAIDVMKKTLSWLMLLSGIQKKHEPTNEGE